MSKVLQATCTGQVVTAEGVVVPGVQIVAEGVGPSAGILILDGDARWYVAKQSRRSARHRTAWEAHQGD